LTTSLNTNQRDACPFYSYVLCRGQTRITCADGIDVEGDGNKIKYNWVKDSNYDGIVLDCPSSPRMCFGGINHGDPCFSNSDCPDGECPPPCVGGAENNVVIGNVVKNNCILEPFFSGDGEIVALEGATDNLIRRNTAFGNNCNADLVDQNVDCDNNNWISNIFGTKNMDCIN